MPLFMIIYRIIFSTFFFFLLSPTYAAASNYVILSISKQGLREVRIASKNKMVMETSLPDGPSANGLAFSRATDGNVVVDAVVRHGLIEDCGVLTSPSDVAAFVSDFTRVQPESSFRNESELLDVYLGLKNISSFYSASEYSSSNPRLHSHAHGTTGARAGQPKMTAEFGALSNSSFASMFQRFFRTKRIAKDCEKFYEEAQRRLEVLTQLVESVDQLEVEASRLHMNDSRGREVLGQGDHRHRHRHHQHHQHHHPHRRRYHQHLRAGGNEKDLSSRELANVSSDSLHLPNTSLDLQTDISRNPAGVSQGFFNDSEHSVVDNDAPAADNISISDSDTGLSHDSPLSSRNYSSEAPTFPPSEIPTTSPRYGRIGPNFYDPGDSTPGSKATSVLDTTSVGVTSSADLFDRPEPQLTSSSRSRSRTRRDLLTGWMIFPGTKWCGDGDIAENKHDLGYHLELDKCCRRHDLCPLVIPRLSWRYGMFNYRLHTISHCRCDRKFRKCLKASDSPLAHLIGQIFFNVVGPQCFKFKQETTCVQRFWWGGCKEWGDSKVAFVKKQRRFK